GIQIRPRIKRSSRGWSGSARTNAAARTPTGAVVRLVRAGAGLGAIASARRPRTGPDTRRGAFGAARCEMPRLGPWIPARWFSRGALARVPDPWLAARGAWRAGRGAWRAAPVRAPGLSLEAARFFVAARPAGVTADGVTGPSPRACERRADARTSTSGSPP